MPLHARQLQKRLREEATQTDAKNRYYSSAQLHAREILKRLREESVLIVNRHNLVTIVSVTVGPVDRVSKRGALSDTQMTSDRIGKNLSKTV